MGAITRQITRSYLRKHNKKHLKKYPQLASFSFDLITEYIHLDGRYEYEELEFLANSVFPQIGDHKVCLDIGANIGNHSVFFAEHFENVISFEPHPRTFKLLDCNADLVDNIVPLNIGASDKKTTQTAYFDVMNVAFSSLDPELPERSGPPLKEVQFKLNRLDDIPEVKKVKQIDFVKIDVEGHEESCFAGALKTFEKHTPLIGIEILGKRVKNGETASLKMLEPLGYKYFYNLRTNRPMAWAPKPIAKFTTVLLGLFLNYRPPKSFTLEPLVLRSDRNFSMVLCSTTELK
jgi:FkbM family methyltransferase